MQLRQPDDLTCIEKKDFSSDISWFTSSLLIFAIVLIIVAVDSKTDYETALKNAEIVSSFNTLSFEDRRVINSWAHFSKINQETLLLPNIAVPVSKISKFYASLPHLICAYLLVWLILASITLWKYWRRIMKLDKSERYFLVDMPINLLYIWLANLVMLPLFIVMMGSGIRIFLYEYVYGSPKIQDEKSKTKLNNPISQEQEQASITNKSDRQKYLLSRTTLFQPHCVKTEEAVKAVVEECFMDLQKSAQALQEAQRRYGLAQANLRTFQETIYSGPITMAEARAEWRAVKDMRGVSRIYTESTPDLKSVNLCYLIKVRVPYHGRIYDFGDFVVKISCNTAKLSCTEIRSGIRKRATSLAPAYRITKHSFCFGDREYEIKKHVANGQLIAAMTLVVDCLHSVNPEDAPDIPRCFRKVRTIKRTQNHIQKGEEI